MNNRQGIGQSLRTMRKSRRMTQAEVGQKMGISQSRVSRIEREGPATLDVAFRFAKACGSTVEIRHGRMVVNPTSANQLLYGRR